MLPLLVTALGWIGLHVLIAGPFRAALVGRMGETPYRLFFSIASALLLGALVLGYRAAPYHPLWAAPQWTYVWAHLCMVPAFVLLTLSLTDSPTAVSAGTRTFEARGVFRITRHPMLNAFALWAIGHAPANGDVATLILLGAILITALNGMASIDRKRAATLGAAWAPFAASTSRLPFVAIAQGRNRLALGELSWGRIALGIVLYLGALAVHGLIGPPLL